MFAAEASSDSTSQWSEPAFADVGEVPPASSLSLTPEEVAVLEALDDAADAFAALSLSAIAAEGDDAIGRSGSCVASGSRDAAPDRLDLAAWRLAGPRPSFTELSDRSSVR
jgi:hypothetical protein